MLASDHMLTTAAAQSALLSPSCEAEQLGETHSAVRGLEAREGWWVLAWILLWLCRMPRTGMCSGEDPRGDVPVVHSSSAYTSQ